MKIQIWSDFSCPFCYIGKHHLSAALYAFSDRENIDLLFRSFELDPNRPVNRRSNIYTHLSEKYDMSIHQAEEITERITHQAKRIGLNFNFDTLLPANTFDAHRLLHFASEQGVMMQMSEILFKAYFIDSLNIADGATLIGLAGEAKLDQQRVREILQSEKYADRVRADESFAKQLKITSVPFFIFDNKYAVSGAQPTAVFSEVLQKVQEEAQRLSCLESKRQGDGPTYAADFYGR